VLAPHPWQHLEALDHLRRVLAPVGLDQAGDNVGAAGETAAALVEHGDRLAHPGGRPEVDAMPTARHGSLSLTVGGGVGGLEGDVELGHVHAVLPDEAEGGVLDPTTVPRSESSEPCAWLGASKPAPRRAGWSTPSTVRAARGPAR
jgi:hypothetical protein